MVFKDAYTTYALIDADKDGIENKKAVLSNDAYALGDIIQELASELSKLRLSKK